MYQMNNVNKRHFKMPNLECFENADFMESDSTRFAFKPKN